MARIAYWPLPHQEKFHASRRPKVFLSGGYGCGKTHSLVMHMFHLMNENKGVPGGLLVPNLKMFKRDFMPTVREIMTENRISFDYNRADSVYHFPESKSDVYIYHAEDDGDSIKGANLGFGLINEVTLINKKSFDAFLSRIRLKRTNLMQLAMSGTPESFSWHYEYFIEKPRADTDLIFASSRDNPHLADSYVAGLEASYDELMVKQYVDGQYINLTGKRAAWAFDRFKHVREGIERIPGLPVWVSLDFNVAPMAATFWNRMDLNSTVKLQAFDEIRLDNSNTFEIARVIREKVGLECTIYPDPAGGARSTNGLFSDIQILKNEGFQTGNIKYKKSIVSVRQCLNSMNAILGRNEVLFSPKCRNIIADAEQCVLKSNGNEIDKSNPARSHWLDGFKDMCDYEFPILKPDSKVGVTRYA